MSPARTTPSDSMDRKGTCARALAAAVAVLGGAAATLCAGCHEEPPRAVCVDGEAWSPVPDGRRVAVRLDFGGAHLEPGTDEDARSGVTPLLDAPLDVPPFDGAPFSTVGPAGVSGPQVAASVKGLLAPFAIDLVEELPEGAEVVRVVVGGAAAAAGFPEGQRGASTQRCGAAPEGGAIALVFQDSAPSASLLAASIAHEVGHTMGLSHGVNEWDIMYSFPDGRQLAWLPDDVSGPSCSPDLRQDPREVLPARADAPGLAVVWPPPDALVAPVFAVIAAPSTRVRDARVALRIDGCIAAVADGPPYGFVVEQGAAEATMDIEVAALVSDVELGAPAAVEVRVSGESAREPWLSGVDGGLDDTPCAGVRAASFARLGASQTWRGAGQPCMKGEECESSFCAAGEDGTGVCVSPCAPGSDESCPEPWRCLPAGGSAVCVPADEVSCGPEAEARAAEVDLVFSSEGT